MERQALAEVLHRVRGAVASKPTIPAFGAVFFDGQYAVAYDDEVAIQTPCDLNVVGGIEHKTLETWVNGCNGLMVEASEVGDQIEFKCGRSRVLTTLLEPDCLTFKQPFGSSVEIREPSAIVDAVGRAKPFMGTNPSLHSWMLGITLTVDDNAVLSATNNVALTSIVAVADAEAPAQVLLSARFVEQLLAISKKVPIAALDIGDGWITASFEDDSVLFTRTSADCAPEHFQQLIEQKEAEAAARVELNEDVLRAAKNVDKVLRAVDSINVDVVVVDGRVQISSTDEARVRVEDEADFDHPDTALAVRSSDFVLGLENALSVFLGETAIVFWNEDSVSLVSVGAHKKG